MRQQEPGVGLFFDYSVQQYFSPDIEAFCDILLRRLIPVFDDVEAEQQRAGNEFLAAYKGDPDRYDDLMEAAYDHSISHAMRFHEMRDVFLAVGVSGLFHLFEKQVYRHLNRDLRRYFADPFAHWRDVEELVGKLTFKLEDRGCVPSTELTDAFRDPDLVELQRVANVVKHGQDGSAYRALVESNSNVVGPEPHLAPFSIFRVSLSLTPEDVMRYRDAILRFWALRGEFWAPVTAFKQKG
jgi:hypothetical protein